MKDICYRGWQGVDLYIRQVSIDPLGGGCRHSDGRGPAPSEAF